LQEGGLEEGIISCVTQVMTIELGAAVKARCQKKPVEGSLILVSFFLFISYANNFFFIESSFS
jgi:hypothetical protein